MTYSQLINALDMEVNSYRPLLTEAKQTSILIENFRHNYFSYSNAKAKKELDDAKNDTSFHTVYRIKPTIKVNSAYKRDWDTFVRVAFEFLDCEKNQDIINEIFTLKIKLESEIEKLDPNATEPLDTSFKKILDDFEHEAGFAKCITIKKEDGILTAEQFFKIIVDGHPFYDDGAPPQHGPLAHRVQCYLLGQYIKNNIKKFFPNEHGFQQLKLDLAKAYPKLTENGLFPAHKVISVFYRMLGQEEFQNSFDWKQFNAKVQKKNNKLNPHKEFPASLNMPYIWTQMFDRFGYAGYFNVPSNFGFIQSLGGFSFLPKLGLPATIPNQERFDKHLKTVLDVTPKFLKIEPSKKDNDYRSNVGVLFFAPPQERTYIFKETNSDNMLEYAHILKR